jgi:hypothetical protein
MSSPDIPDPTAAPKPDPIVTDEDQQGGEGARKSANKSKIAALYGSQSFAVTGASGVAGGATTAGKTALGA